MKTSIRVMVPALALIALIACDGSEPARDDPTLIDYRRTGGIAGLDDHLIIYDDGSATFETRDGARRPVELSEDDFTDIEQLVSDVDWEALEGDHPADALVNDGYGYTLIHEGITVTTETLGEPDELQPLIHALDVAMGRRPS